MNRNPFVEIPVIAVVLAAVLWGTAGWIVTIVIAAIFSPWFCFLFFTNLIAIAILIWLDSL